MSNTSGLEQELRAGRAVIAETEGDSMEPLLYNHSTRVVVEPVKGELKRGELPLYRRPTGQYVMHRIIKVDAEHYYTRGDNRIWLESVPKEWVLGVVTEIYRKGKTFPVTDRKYRAYVRLWPLTHPMRWVIYQFKVRIKRMK